MNQRHFFGAILFIESRTPAHRMVPHVGWVFPLRLVSSRKCLTDTMPRVCCHSNAKSYQVSKMNHHRKNQSVGRQDTYQGMLPVKNSSIRTGQGHHGGITGKDSHIGGSTGHPHCCALSGKSVMILPLISPSLPLFLPSAPRPHVCLCLFLDF